MAGHLKSIALDPHLREKMLQLRLTVDDIENGVLRGYIVYEIEEE